MPLGQRWLSSLSFNNVRNAFVSASISRGITSPHLFATNSLIPHWSLTITGLPHAMASAAEFAKFSYREGSANTSQSVSAASLGRSYKGACEDRAVTDSCAGGDGFQFRSIVGFSLRTRDNQSAPFRACFRESGHQQVRSLSRDQSTEEKHYGFIYGNLPLVSELAGRRQVREVLQIDTVVPQRYLFPRPSLLNHFVFFPMRGCNHHRGIPHQWFAQRTMPHAL
jgi:hypothetical protein